MPAAVLSAFKTTGQRCVSAERLIVHEDVYDDFRDRFVDAAERVVVGDPLDESTFMGPLIDPDAVAKFHEYNALAREEEATVLVDRAALDPDEIPDGGDAGHWVGPFVYEMAYGSDHRVLHEEVFGPHVALIPSSAESSGQSRFTTPSTTGWRARSSARTTANSTTTATRRPRGWPTPTSPVSAPRCNSRSAASASRARERPPPAR